MSIPELARLIILSEVPDYYLLANPPIRAEYLELVEWLDNTPSTRAAGRVQLAVDTFVNSDFFTDWVFEILTVELYPSMADYPTFYELTFYHVSVANPSLIPARTVVHNTLAAAEITEVAKIHIDKMMKSLLAGDRPKLKLEGNLKFKHWETYYRALDTLT